MLAARKSGPPHLTGLLPRACRLPDPVRQRLPRPARRVLAAGQAGRCGTRTPASRCRPAGLAGGQRLACYRAWPARVQGRAPGLPVTRPPAQQPGGPASRAPARPLRSHCAGVPGGRPRRQPSGEGGGARGRPVICPWRQPARVRPGCCASACHRGRSLPRSAIPVPRSRHSARLEARFRGAVNQRMDGRGHVPQPVYLACTCAVPPADLDAKQKASGGFDRARAGWPRLTAGTGSLPAGQVTARSTGGRRQAGRGSAGGRPGVHRRSAPGHWRLAA